MSFLGHFLRRPSLELMQFSSLTRKKHPPAPIKFNFNIDFDSTSSYDWIWAMGKGWLLPAMRSDRTAWATFAVEEPSLTNNSAVRWTNSACSATFPSLLIYFITPKFHKFIAIYEMPALNHPFSAQYLQKHISHKKNIYSYDEFNNWLCWIKWMNNFKI